MFHNRSKIRQLHGTVHQFKKLDYKRDSKITKKNITFNWNLKLSDKKHFINQESQMKKYNLKVQNVDDFEDEISSNEYQDEFVKK